jgi:hypothetical protein
MILVPRLRPREDQEVSSTGRKYVVTIYSGKIVRLYDLGARRSVVSTPRKMIAGQPRMAAKGKFHERGSPFE